MASMTDFLDDDSLQKLFKRMNVDQVNQQAIASADPGTPPPNPYGGGGGGKKGILGTIGSIAAPIMKLGGMAASALGAPYIGVPLSIAGAAVGGGTERGVSGALEGAGKAGLTEAATFGMGKGLDLLKAPINDPINLASKGLAIPGRRLNPIDMGNLTVPASPKSFGGGMS